QPEDEQPTTVFSPSGLVAWALAPDDGPPTTVLHLDLPPAEPDVRPSRGSTGAHRAVAIGSLPVVPLRRLAHRNPVAFAGGPGLALLVIPTRNSSTAPPAQAALVAPGQVNGLALGDDRLPDCASVVASLSPRQKLAQRLMVSVNGADPAATARLVHEMQIGGI